MKVMSRATFGALVLVAFLSACSSGISPVPTSPPPATSSPNGLAEHSTSVPNVGPTSTPEPLVELPVPALATPEKEGWPPLPGVPELTTVSTIPGCTEYATPQVCKPYNFYWAPSREIVMVVDELDRRVHELCHAHQHWTILMETGREPIDVTLSEWVYTEEGRSFLKIRSVGWGSWPWGTISTRQDVIEDFAETCTWGLLDPVYLESVDSYRFNWFADRFWDY